MRAHKNYLLSLGASPSETAVEGPQATIYDWSGGSSFQVVTVTFTRSQLHPAAHVLAISDNAYSSSNYQNSRLRYRIANDQQETREITGVTLLDNED